MMVAAASACDAVRASTVTASAIPSEKLRPCRPLVAMPRDRIVGFDADRSHQAMTVRPVHQPDGELLAAGQMQRDVAAIVDVGAIEPRRAEHRAENFFRDAAGHRRHRRDEMIGRKRRHRRMHAARDDTLQRAPSRIGSPSKFDQFRAEFIEQAGEAPRRGLVGGAHLDLHVPSPR